MCGISWAISNSIRHYGDMAKILLVEDNLDLSSSISSCLQKDYHTVEVVHDGLDALQMLRSYGYDIVLLDWELPKMSGIELLTKFRKEGGAIPILMLTGKGELPDRKEGFDAGADDYLIKPFHMEELSLRIRALLRRSGVAINMVLKARDIELEPDTFTVRKSGVEIKLLPKEFALLEFFLRHPDQVFSLESLLTHIWQSDSDASTEAVNACIRRLRKKIDSPDQSTMIENVHGVGYKLVRT